MQTTQQLPFGSVEMSEVSDAASMASQPPAAKLHPKEHGAYAILAVPILAGLLIAGPTLVGICIAVAAVAGFLAHEPLLVAVGHRGRRAQRVTPAAQSRLAVLLSVTIIAGGAALALGSPVVRSALVGCLMLSAVSFALAVMGNHRTMYGQMWGVVGLSAPCLPILLAGGIEVTVAITIWIAWVLGFSANTVAVRSVIAAQKGQSRALHVSLLAAITFAFVVAAVQRVHLPLAALPMLGLSLVLLVWPPPAKHIKRVGWTLVAGTIATGVIVCSL